MRRAMLILIAASAIVATTLSAPAGAMTVGAASGIEAALADMSALTNAAYVCRHRVLTSRRVCRWQPTYRHRYWRSRRWW
jgi:hypothetical protein